MTTTPARSPTYPWATLTGPSSRSCCVKETSVSNPLPQIPGGNGTRPGKSNRCISDAEPRMPRQRNSMLPIRAMSRRKRFLASSTHIALVGGRLDRAAFQLTPFLGSNMSGYLPMVLGATTRGQWRGCEARPAAVVCSCVGRVEVGSGRADAGCCRDRSWRSWLVVASS